MEEQDTRIKISAALKRRSSGIFPSEQEAIERLSSGKLSIYLGIDPTGPSIHLGHTIPLLLLKELARLGHHPIVLIGDFTARIGDPTDKEAVRTVLSGSDVAQNMRTYIDQIDRIFAGVAYEVRYNSEWLSRLTLEDVIQLAQHVTVQQMIARDMFRERISNEKPIFLNEFLYPLMQGYDSVALAVDGEIGGNDQIFNMLIGRDLAAVYNKKDKIVIATRLLVDEKSGKKMSKTEGNLIAINDEPAEIRRKILMLDDKTLRTVAELCTEMPYEWIDEGQEEGQAPQNPRQFKEDLAQELVRMYYGESATGKADKPREYMPGRWPVSIVQLLQEADCAVSASEAKRLVSEHAVTIDGETVTDWTYKPKSGSVIRVGKGKFIRVVKK